MSAGGQQPSMRDGEQIMAAVTPAPEPAVVKRRGVRVRCPFGGWVPCCDDLCHGVDQTICGMEFGFDFCEHDYDPETCPECSEEREDRDDEPDDDA